MIRSLALLLMFVPAVAYAQMVEPEWAACKEASECVALKGICLSNWHAVNTAHAAALEAKIAELRESTKCSWPPLELAPAELDCINGLCVVTNDGH